PADRDIAGAARPDAPAHQRGRIDQQPGADTLVETVVAQCPHLRADARQRVRRGVVHAALVGDDPRLDLEWRVVELDAGEALPGRGLQVLERALVARVV